MKNNVVKQIMKHLRSMALGPKLAFGISSSMILLLLNSCETNCQDESLPVRRSSSNKLNFTLKTQLNGGFHQWGYPQMDGWFISWKILCWMKLDDLGVPP